MSCSSCNCNPCHCDHECDPSNEPLSSALDNFITAFFGTVTKTCVNDQVVWALPCDLESGLAGYPRVPNEGLACYLLRVMGILIIPDDCCFEAQTVWVDKNATELSARGMPAYLTFQGGYDAANAMQVALGGSNVVDLRIGVMTAAESGNLNLTAPYNPNVTITGINQQASKLGLISGDSSTNGVNARAIDIKLKSVSVTGIVSRYIGVDLATNGGDLNITAISDVFLGGIDSSSVSGGSGGSINILSDRGSGVGLGRVAGDINSRGRINGGNIDLVGIVAEDLDLRGETGNGGQLSAHECTFGETRMGPNNPGRVRVFESFCQTIDWVKGTGGGNNSIFSGVIFTSSGGQDCVDDIFADNPIFMNCIFDPNGAGFCINSTTPKSVIIYNGLSSTSEGPNVTVNGTLTVDPAMQAPY